MRRFLKKICICAQTNSLVLCFVCCVDDWMPDSTDDADIFVSKGRHC